MPENELQQVPEKENGGFWTDLFFWLQAMVTALVCLILVFTFLGREIGVQGSSMTNTLHEGDMLLLRSIGYSPRQGDIVVLKKEFTNVTAEPIIKRVIALGGQTVQIDYDTGTVFVDGEALDEPYIKEFMLRPSNPNMSIDYMEVPEGSIFVMGDNRNGSNDSRDVRLGSVDERYVLGKALFVIFPFRDFGAVH